MKYLVSPADRIEGEIIIPGDKSISHRAVMFGSIAQGTTHIEGFLDGEDCLATLSAFQNMGVKVERIHDTELKIAGVGMRGLDAPKSALDVGNSGTSMRLMTGLLSAQAFDSELIGDHSLMQRPMRRVCDPLSKMGVNVQTSESGTPPVRIKSVSELQGISYHMPVASAQVKSALLLAGLYAQGEIEVIEDKLTRDHTERMLRTFGIAVTSQQGRVSLSAKMDARTLRAAPISVPADISSAAFFIVAGCIANAGEIVMHNIGMNPTRTGLLTVLESMGAKLKIFNQATLGDEPVASIAVKPSQLRGIKIPPEVVPCAIDEFPILCIAAACAEGVTEITGAAELRVKESDRIAQMANGLQVLGIEVEEFADGMKIKGGRFTGGKIESGSDHRIAMSFAIASLQAQAEIEINDCSNVATSFPNFVASANTLGLSINVAE